VTTPAPPDSDQNGHRKREVCPACRRPRVVCHCDLVRPRATRTRLLLLQHARESRMPIGTARLAHLGLSSSTLLAGTRFDDDPAVEAWLASAPNAHVLFPGAGARDIASLAPAATAPDAPPPALVVVDGTWWQAQKLLRLNPRLASLPRVAFTPAAPSQYRIRKQPDAFCVSTIEALAEVLTVVEPEGAPYDDLLAPFHAMVEGQLRFAQEVKSERHAQAKRARALSRKPSFPERVREVWDRLVCVQGEANAWPAALAERPAPELVHWVAHRMRDDRRFDAVIAPEGALAPSTPQHVGLTADQIAHGLTRETWLAAWASFLAPDDILVHWGTFHQNLAAASGAASTGSSWDLRFELSRWKRRRIGLLEEGLGLVAPPLALSPGTAQGPRALRRLEGLVTLLRAAREETVTGAAFGSSGVSGRLV